MSKKLYLIRHGESINNADKALLYQSWLNLKNGILPNWITLKRLIYLLKLPMDTELTEQGHQQVTELKSKLNIQADLILYSPLKRARETCQGLFPLQETVECPLIYERDVWETLGLSSLNTRVKQFITWLNTLPCNSIVVVGHGAFFQCLLNSKTCMNNCQVVTCNLTKEDQIINVN